MRRSIDAFLGGNSQDLLRCLTAAAALHDLGKLSPTFQDKLPETVTALGRSVKSLKGTVRHDSLGWVLWRKELENSLALSEAEQTSARVWVRCATGHHGEPPSLASDGNPIKLKAHFETEELFAARQWVASLFDLLKPRWDSFTEEDLDNGSWWLAGLINLADWVGSSTQWFPYETQVISLADYWERAQAQAKRAVKESGLLTDSPKKTFSELFPGYQPTPVQKLIADNPGQEPFFLVIEESTGGGKTEAALAAAGGSGFFFGLPTMATANGLWARVGAVGGQQTLIHGKRWLLPGAMGRASSWLNNSSRTALISDIGVGTIDQAMLSVLLTRFNALRVIGLCGRTLIIDEVHAYDPYMTRVIERLVKMHASAGGSVILLSATMPLKTRQSLSDAWAAGRKIVKPQLNSVAFPCVSRVDESGYSQTEVPSRYSRTIAIRRLHTEQSCVEELMTIAQNGACGVWIRNTVSEAIKSYETLKALGCDAMLFHARFVAKDRFDRERDVLRAFGKDSVQHERAGKILIATQVVEQSLDLDFDHMISDLAPVDLLIQRAGRLQRHSHRGSRSSPTLVIHMPSLEEEPEKSWVREWSSGTSFVYPDHARLWASQSVLGQQIHLPVQTRQLVEAVYGDIDPSWPTALLEASDKVKDKLVKDTLAANSNLIRDKFAADNFVFKDETAPTRLGEPSTEWVICNNGRPIYDDIELSTISLSSHIIMSGPSVKGIDVGSWRKTLNLTDGSALAKSTGGAEVSVTYDPQSGLVKR